MERRNFFKIAPFGLLGIAVLAQNTLSVDQPKSTTKKSKQITIHANGKNYHPLVVEVEDTTFEELPAHDDILGRPTPVFTVHTK